jgi:hypothetical protein
VIDPMRETILKLAPDARFVKLDVPPVIGATILGMEAGGLLATKDIRKRMNETIKVMG